MALETMQILLDSLEMTERRRFSPSEIARALNVSEQVVHNWSKRGISMEGALAAQMAFHKDANYILGRLPHPMMLARPQPGREPPAAVMVVREPDVAYLDKTTKDREQQELLELFSQLDPQGKIEALAELRGFVRGRRPLNDGDAPAMAHKK